MAKVSPEARNKPPFDRRTWETENLEPWQNAFWKNEKKETKKEIQKAISSTLIRKWSPLYASHMSDSFNWEAKKEKAFEGRRQKWSVWAAELAWQWKFISVLNFLYFNLNE